MNKIKNLFLDLDGTLTDPKEGITKSIQHALVQMNVEPPSMDDLEWTIGPPLTVAFAKLLNTTDQVAVQKAIDHYRDRYVGICMIENIPYQGIENTLATLKGAGYKLYLATSKPWAYAEKILSHFKLENYFTAIHGSELDGTRDYKEELLAYILNMHQLRAHETVMIGDRLHDVLGAKHNKIFSIGVTYGYGSHQELKEAGADLLCDHHGRLTEIFPKKLDT